MKHKKIILITIISSVLFFAGCIQHKKPEHNIVLIKTNFTHLPGWEKDDHKKALETLQRSCVAIAKRNPDQLFGKLIPEAGMVSDWQKICSAVDDIDKDDALSARKFFEYWFEPYHVHDNNNPKGLFTGYYLPTLDCRLKKNKHYATPIYANPDDWVKVDLGLFDERLKGKTFVGQVKNKTLCRYPDRKAIARGMIDKKAKTLAWCRDKVDVAFSHIQGSALVKLSNKKHFLVGYDGSNGRPYTALSKILINDNKLTPQNSSMQDIRAWFLQNPEKTEAILDKNASYVFFKVLDNSDPIGSEQVPLTKERSLAIDKRYFPLGIPVWLDTIIPDEDPEGFIPFRRLLIAQDTGGAIRGIVRGDVYWGSGDHAAFTAGHMKSKGTYWFLLPRPRA